MQVIFWLIVAIALIAVEAVTVTLVAAWFSGGAVAAMLVSAIGGGFVLQVVVFCIASLILLGLVRPLAKKHYKPTPTNAEAMVGEIGTVTEDPDKNGTFARVRVKGQDWAAAMEDGSPLKKGMPVTVTGIEGAKLIVKGTTDREQKKE